MSTEFESNGNVSIRKRRACNSRSLMLVIALMAGAMTQSAEAVRVWDVVAASGSTTGGGFATNGTWSQMPTNAFSMGMWTRSLTATWHLYLADVPGCFSVYYGNGGKVLNFSTKQQGDSSVTAVTVSCPETVFSRYKKTGVPCIDDGDWHFVAVSFNYDEADSTKSFQRLYVDGSLVAEKTGSEILGPVANNNTKYARLIFGGELGTNSSGGWWLNWSLLTGRYAEISFWNCALSSTDIATLHSRRTGGFEPGLIGYWSLDTATVSCANMAKNGFNRSLAGTSNGTKSVQDDDAFPLVNSIRYVVSPQWAQEHGYTPPAMASYRSWADAAVDIQTAVDCSLENDEIRVMPGTYTLTHEIAVTNANRTVTSYDPDTGKPDRARTIIDCNSACRGFTIGKGGTTDVNVEVRGFTVKNGVNDAGNGGGVYLIGPASSLANLSRRGRLVDCTVTNCTASRCGGICINGGYVTNCLVACCVGTVACGGIGSVYAAQYANASANEHHVSCVYDCDIVGNRSVWGGGMGDTSECHWYTFIIRNSRFRDNKAKATASGQVARGGHLDVSAGSLVEGCTFSGDCVANYGSCLEMGSGEKSACPPTITNCFFVGATSGGGYGYLHPSSRAKIIGCVVTNNKYTVSFIFNEGCANVLVRQCLFADNTRSDVVQSHASSSAVIENCTVATTGDMKVESASASKDVFANCILCGTVKSSSSHQTIVSNCLVKALSGTPHEANYNAYVGRKPGFRDASRGVYTLRPGAFAREKGARSDWMSKGVDLLGNPRLVNRAGEAYAADALPDLGCYEQQSALPGLMFVVR